MAVLHAQLGNIRTPPLNQAAKHALLDTTAQLQLSPCFILVLLGSTALVPQVVARLARQGDTNPLARWHRASRVLWELTARARGSRPSPRALAANTARALLFIARLVRQGGTSRALRSRRAFRALVVTTAQARD